MSWHTLIIFRIYIIENQAGFCFFSQKKYSQMQKFVGKRDFRIQNSYSGQVQCLSHSRDQKFVTSLVQSANQFKSLGNNKCLNQKQLGGRRR